MVSMIPFGLLAGFVEGREVRITEIDESGFCFRTIEENISDSEALKVCFYDIKNGCYRELEIPEYDIQRFDMVDAELSGFYVKYKVTVKQKAYAEAVQRLLYQYNHYIHLKLEEDDSALAKSLTGYPGELDEVKRGSLEEQVGIWRRELTPDGLESAYNGKRIDLTDNCSQYGTGFEPGYKCQVPPESGVAELALEIDRPELYQEYLNSSLTEFSKKYAGKCIGICGSIILEHRVPDHLYIGNQFCHLLFPERKLLFEIIEKAAAEQVEITLVFSYIREYMLDYITELLDEINSSTRRGTMFFAFWIRFPFSKSAPRAICAFMILSVSSRRIGIKRRAIDIIIAISCTGTWSLFSGRSRRSRPSVSWLGVVVSVIMEEPITR